MLSLKYIGVSTAPILAITMTVHYTWIYQECLMIYLQRKKCSSQNHTQRHQIVFVPPIFYFKKCTERTSGRKISTRTPGEKQWNTTANIFPDCLNNGFTISSRTFQEWLWYFFSCFAACLNNNGAGYCRNQTCSMTGSSKKHFYQLGFARVTSRLCWEMSYSRRSK